MPSQLTVTAVLTVKFFYKRSWFSFTIKKKGTWTKFGEWQKLKDELKTFALLENMGKSEFNAAILKGKKNLAIYERYKQVTWDGPGLGFPNYHQIGKMTYPGDPSFGDGDKTPKDSGFLGEKWLYSNVFESNEPLKMADGEELVDRPSKDIGSPLLNLLRKKVKAQLRSMFNSGLRRATKVDQDPQGGP